jgi:hypothetical protein
MPNPETIRKAAEKREARKAARAGNEDAVVTQTKELAALTQLQKAAKKDPAAAAELREKQPPKPVAKPMTKKQRQVAARAAAEKQADADARVVPTVDEDKLDLEYYTSRGIEIPLHILNQIAKRNDTAIRDDARDLARAVGQVAYEQALDRDHRNRHSRERKVNKAIAEADRAKAEKAAAEKAAAKE